MKDGFEVVIDYEIWIEKVKTGKNLPQNCFEMARPIVKPSVCLVGDWIGYFDAGKEVIFSELQKTDDQAVILLRSADKKKSGLRWLAFVTGTKTYPKTGERAVVIVDDVSWMMWLRACHASREKVCGLKLVMENPNLAQKKERQVCAMSGFSLDVVLIV